MSSWRLRRFAAGLPPLPAAPNNLVVCYVTDRRSLGPGSSASVPSVLEKIRAAAQAGVDWIQIRRVIVNDRLDVALAAGAAGVHLGGESAPAREVVRWCRAGNAPAGFRIGVSCHNVQETHEAEDAGADYALFGPIYDAPSKRSYGAPQGIAGLKEVCGAARITVIAIGGVNEENAAECIRAGAAGIAAIRMFQEAKSTQALADAVALIHRLI